MCFAHGRNAVPPVRLEPATPQSCLYFDISGDYKFHGYVSSS